MIRMPTFEQLTRPRPAEPYTLTPDEETATRLYARAKAGLPASDADLVELGYALRGAEEARKSRSQRNGGEQAPVRSIACNTRWWALCEAVRAGHTDEKARLTFMAPLVKGVARDVMKLTPEDERHALFMKTALPERLPTRTAVSADLLAERFARGDSFEEAREYVESRSDHHP